MSEEIPCLTNLDANCPRNCKLRLMAEARIDDFAQKLSVVLGRRVTRDRATAMMRTLPMGARIGTNTQVVEDLETRNRADECLYYQPGQLIRGQG